MKETKKALHTDGGLKGDGGSWLSSFSIRYPVTVCMALLTFLLLGIVSMTRIPLVLLPSINAPFIVVVAPYPNATPQQILDKLSHWREVVGRFDLIFGFRGAGMPFEDAERSQRLIAQKVIPELRQWDVEAKAA